jgi:hypothetical protein
MRTTMTPHQKWKQGEDIEMTMSNLMKVLKVQSNNPQ